MTMNRAVSGKMNINVVPANGMVQAEAKAVKGKVLRRG